MGMSHVTDELIRATRANAARLVNTQKAEARRGLMTAPGFFIGGTRPVSDG